MSAPRCGKACLLSRVTCALRAGHYGPCARGGATLTTRPEDLPAQVKDRETGRAHRATLAGLGVDIEKPGDPFEAWHVAANVWENRARAAEARADAAEKERDELRERCVRLDKALDDMAGPAR